MRLGGNVRVFNEIAFGSYMEWACPAVPVFMDTRFELYDEALWRDYIAVSDGRWDWEAILARYGVDTILAGKAESRLPDRTHSRGAGLGQLATCSTKTTARSFSRRDEAPS